MNPDALYVVAGAAIFFAGLAGSLGRSHLFWKVLGVNFMGSGVFLVLLAGAPRLPGHGADPVPQAMVLTGIVVAAAATALALGVALRVAIRSGRPWLAEDESLAERPGATRRRGGTADGADGRASSDEISS